ncbi:MAG: homoserine O-succinyltransferase [Clostridia bacterium]|nr:homoserine O-succinyltransferase [Clostridia bacterium]
MPIVIPKALPAYKVLSEENIFVMGDVRASTQDIRPIELAIVNLMPTKIETETQLLRLVSNSPLQVKVTLIKTDTYTPTHVSGAHLSRFYKTFEEVRDRRFDGLIITGAPVETLEFEEVKYWKELTDIMDWAERSVTSTLFICWGAQAGLYYHYGIKKRLLPKKLFGIYKNQAVNPFDPLLKGLDDEFRIPMSRHTEIDQAAAQAEPALEVLARGKECGISILKSRDDRKIFLTGHSEYDRDTLYKEYTRDLDQGKPIEPPVDYFTERGDAVNVSWKSTANLIFYNWLNYYVYQVTPFDIDHA